MKKESVLLLAAALILSLAACGNSQNTASAPDSQEPAFSQSAQSAQSAEPTGSSGSDLMRIHTVIENAVKVAKILLRSKDSVAGTISTEPFIQRAFLQADALFGEYFLCG